MTMQTYRQKRDLMAAVKGSTFKYHKAETHKDDSRAFRERMEERRRREQKDAKGAA